MSSWGKENRRKFPRIKYPCMVKIRQGKESEEAFLTHTENVGIGGVSIIFQKEIKIFSPVDVELDLLDMGDNIVCAGKVVWVVQRRADEKTKPMSYDIGVEFEDMPQSETERLEKIVKKFESKTKGS
ncbi:MAG: PilZ domain-containing protein [Candidatus Omnitrophica bacterium]|nr:PilZ domain-containing protein [Candidatus Omnitrophota bacterium]